MKTEPKKHSIHAPSTPVTRKKVMLINNQFFLLLKTDDDSEWSFFPPLDFLLYHRFKLEKQEKSEKPTTTKRSDDQAITHPFSSWNWLISTWMNARKILNKTFKRSKPENRRERQGERERGGREGERGRKEKGKERIRSELTAFPDRIKIRCGRNSSVKIWVHGALLPTSRLSIVFLRTIISHSITRIPFLIIDRFSMSPSLSLCLSVALSPSHYLSLILRQSKIPGNTFDHLLNRNTFML